MPRPTSRTGIPGFHAQKHSRELQGGTPRTYYQFWGQVTHHGITYRTKRRSSMHRAFQDYLALLETHGHPKPTGTPKHPWESQPDSE